MQTTNRTTADNFRKQRPIKHNKLLNYGSRFKLKLAKGASKFERRIVRRSAFAIDGRIGKELNQMRHAILEAQRLATNSHEARRYREAILKERRLEREAKREVRNEREGRS